MKRNGFTLVELIAVIVILGLLIAVGFPLINSTINTSEKKSKEIHEKNIITAAENYAIECETGLMTSCSKAGNVYVTTTSELEKYGFLNQSKDKDAGGNSVNKYGCYRVNIAVSASNPHYTVTTTEGC